MFLSISNGVLENYMMYAVLRHAGQAMHATNDLVAPHVQMHPWHLSKLRENDQRGDTFLVVAKLPEAGHLDISHLLDVRRWNCASKKGPKPPIS